MYRLSSIIIAAMFLLPATSFVVAQQPPEGFRSLFNGKDLTGWYGRPHINPDKYNSMDEKSLSARKASDMLNAKNHWAVIDGVLFNNGQGVYLTTEEEFTDFELQLEYKTVARADSGIYLKATPQVQIWDTTKEGGKWDIGADKGSGGLWNNSPGAKGKDPLVKADKEFGEWNHVRVLQVGARTSVWLNQQLVVDHAIMENFWNRKAPLYRSGPIQLQTHGGQIEWRNIFIKELSANEANEVLSGKNNQGFESVFNGKDFTGWKGATQNNAVVDGVIQSKSGAIFTEKEYGDFVARFEFKLPPGGNNGLAIRYPGTGDPAYSGMCELQVLDDGHEKYKTIQAKQAHGSAYGMVASHRGFLREAGEWNFQEVTVNGSKIKVELNGSIILDCDLSDVKEFMNGKDKHKGLNLKSGHFGFAGHGDPVEYRNIQIKTEQQ